jgi:peptide/nickel transport system permease protein
MATHSVNLSTEVRQRKRHPIRDLILARLAAGVVTLLVVTVVVFAATEVLPGNAAYAILGHNATPASLRALERQLGLDHSVPYQYWHWLSGLLQGHLGTSLASQVSVSTLVWPRVENSALLVVVAGFIGTALAVGLGLLAALRRDTLLDHVLCAILLAVTALPEFVVGMVFVLVFAAVTFHLFPAVSFIPPGQPPWQNVRILVLPIATLVVVIVPYIFRMMRASTIDALESEYVEVARLNGLSPRRVVLRHALPNAIPTTIQVIGLTWLYLAGGIVVVETVFDYPGVGQGLVSAVSDRDVPTIQFIVLLLAAFYVLMNLLTDVVSLAMTPRRRYPR